MIALDSNILVHAHREDSLWHASAFECVRNLAEGRAPWGIPWPCLHEFLAVTTHPRIFAPPTPPGKAVDQVEAWLESPRLALLAEDDGYWPGLRDLMMRGRISGPRVHDARVAAICLRHGVDELWTIDRDFSRFPSLRTRNPLSGA
ncbi:MAG: PIN domain-containing protein [Candidatus Aminicenantes bacterium]|nr:PIN domain-containing protein [Candidatus Aminicenantes bacterium]